MDHTRHDDKVESTRQYASTYENSDDYNRDYVDTLVWHLLQFFTVHDSVYDRQDGYSTETWPMSIVHRHTGDIVHAQFCIPRYLSVVDKWCSGEIFEVDLMVSWHPGQMAEMKLSACRTLICWRCTERFVLYKLTFWRDEYLTRN